MLQKIFSFPLIFLFSTFSIAQQINGIVLDSSSNEALPFASVGFVKQLTGTLTNEKGEFNLLNDNSNFPDTLQVSYMGYESFKISTANINSALTIRLTAKSIELNEILIEPQEPIWYIKQAMKNRYKNYPQNPYQSHAYYNEIIKENDNYTKYTEAVFKSNHPVYTDTSKSIHQLMLYRKAENIEEMQFMKERIKKQNEKKKKKAEKIGEEYEDDMNSVKASFGGPDNIMGIDVVKSAEGFLDSTLFEKYKYTFAGASNYGNNQVVVIAFQSKKTIEHLKQYGKIYIDIYTDAIVGIDFWADYVIPTYFKPFLFAMGLKINKPTVNAKSRYRMIDNTWFPENFQWKMNANITKKYMFKKNEHASFEVEQILSMDKIKPDVAITIPKSKRFNVNEKMPEQVFNDEDLNWNQINTMKVSY